MFHTRLSFVLISLILFSRAFSQPEKATHRVEKTVDSLNTLFRSEIASDPLKSKSYARQMLAYSKTNSSLRGQALSYLGLGMSCIATGSYDSALTFYETGLPYFIKLKDEQGIARTNMGLGTVYNKTGKKENALKHYFDALKYYETAKDSIFMVKALSNIGMVYEAQYRFDKALDIFQRCERINALTRDEMNIADSYGNLGRVYFELANYPAAILQHQKELEIRERMQDSTGLCYTYDNLSNACAASGKLQEALSYQLKAYTLYSAIADQPGMANSECNLGNIYFEQKDLRNALIHLQKGVKLAEHLHANMTLNNCYGTLAEVYSALGDHKQAYEYQVKSSNLKDSIFSFESARQIAEMEALYENEKLAKEKLLVEKENTLLSNEKLKASQQRNYIALISVIIIVLLVLLFYIGNQKRKREEQKQRISAVLLSENNERTRIARELHDGLGQLLSTARLNAAALEDSVEKEDEHLLQTTLRLIDQSVTEVRSVSHNLMPQLLSQKGITEAVKELAESINNSRSISIEFKYTEQPLTLDKSVEITLYRILQEVLNNMIKHAAASRILIEMTRNGSDLNISISDNGKGFDTSLLEKSKGIGWKNIFTRLSVINGRYTLQSSKEQGTRIDIKVPL